MNSSENDFLNHIVNSLSNSLLLLDETNKIIWLNTTAVAYMKNLFGADVSIGDSFIDILAPQHQEALIKNVQKARAHEEVYRETLLNFNGKPVWYASEVKAIENDGQFLGILIESYEITKAKKTQRENILAGATLNAIKNTSNDTSVLISTDKKVLWFNNLFEENVKRFIGVSPIVGGDMMSYVVDSIKENFTLYFDKAINGEHIEVDNELAISPDLAEWFSLDFYPVYNSSSNLLGVFFSARNINNRVRDKEKIIETNTKLKAIIDNTADNYILFDANLNIILANKNANTASEQIHGVPLKEGANISDYYISGVTERFIENSKKVFKGEEVEYEEEINVNGYHFWEQYRLFPVYNNTGEVNYLAFISNDISELKKNYRQLLIERKLFNQGPVVAFKWSLFIDGSISKYVSSNIEDVFGYTIDEILGKSFLDFLHPDDLILLKDYVLNPNWNQVNIDNHAGPYLDLSYRVRCKDGSYKWVNDYSFLAEESNNETLVCGYLIDITERKKALIALEETNSQLKSALARVNTQSKILEVTTNIIVLTDVRGKITWVNDAFEKGTGYSLDEVFGKTTEKILQGPETNLETIEYIKQHVKNEKKVKTEILNYKKNGEKYWLEVIIEPIYDEKGILTAFLAIGSDITERKDFDRKLKERDERLKKFSFITSHELRHEFAKILLLLENKELLLEEALGELDVLTEIEIAANSMNDIISKMNNQLYISDTSEEHANQPSLTIVEEVCLIDDDEIVCFINTKLIKMSLPDKKVVAFQNVDDALEYIKATPQIQRYIFLDLNMPYKTGWDFLEEYKPPSISSPVILLTSSIDDTDREKSKNYPQVISFLTKPLTTEKLEVFIR